MSNLFLDLNGKYIESGKLKELMGYIELDSVSRVFRQGMLYRFGIELNPPHSLHGSLRSDAGLAKLVFIGLTPDDGTPLSGLFKKSTKKPYGNLFVLDKEENGSFAGDYNGRWCSLSRPLEYSINDPVFLSKINQTLRSFHHEGIKISLS